MLIVPLVNEAAAKTDRIVTATPPQKKNTQLDLASPDHIDELC